MTTMRVAQVSRPKGPIEIVERPIPQPGPGMVRVKVHACGVCHSDSIVKEGLFPTIKYPRVPGHEVAGVVDAVGPGVVPWEAGQLVGVGWNGGYCGYCDHCRRGSFFACVRSQVTGLDFDGGYGEFMIAPASAIALMPTELPPLEAAPLLCAGLTTFNALRNSDARAGDVVAVLGLGGLGHLGVQYAAKMGFYTVGIARGKDKESLARKLGAAAHRQSVPGSVAELQKPGRESDLGNGHQRRGHGAARRRGRQRHNASSGPPNRCRSPPRALMGNAPSRDGIPARPSIQDTLFQLAYRCETDERDLSAERGRGHYANDQRQSRFRVVLTMAR